MTTIENIIEFITTHMFESFIIMLVLGCFTLLVCSLGGDVNG